MSMAKGLLPDTHEQCGLRRARSCCGRRRGDADGRAPQLAAVARQGQDLGRQGSKDWGGQKFIQIDISPQEADSNVRIDAPVVGDIGSCVSALLAGIGSVPKPPAEWLNAINERRRPTSPRWPRRWPKKPDTDNFHSALNVVRDIVRPIRTR